MLEFRIEENAARELAEFQSGGKIDMPGALPLVVLTEEEATQLCLELAYHLKQIRDTRNWMRMQEIANDIRAEHDLPPLDPPDPETGFQNRNIVCTCGSWRSHDPHDPTCPRYRP